MPEQWRPEGWTNSYGPNNLGVAFDEGGKAMYEILQSEIARLESEKETILIRTTELLGTACSVHTEKIRQMSFQEFVEFEGIHCKYCLLDALKEIAEAETEICRRCESNGRLYADGKAHYPSENIATIFCPQCGGEGRIPPQDAQEIARRALGWKEEA